MEYIRINSIDDPLFTQLHRLMSEVFPPEEVLELEGAACNDSLCSELGLKCSLELDIVYNGKANMPLVCRGLQNGGTYDA